MATCDCVALVNAKLAERNTRLVRAWVLDPEPRDSDDLLIETEQIERGRGKRKKVSMMPSYCPFCGRKYDRP